MTDEKLEKAMELKSSMKNLRGIRRAFSGSYPEICVRDPGDSYTATFHGLDEFTQKEFKRLIMDYIDKRFEILEKEYDEL